MVNKKVITTAAVIGACLLAPAVAFADASQADQILNQTHSTLLSLSGLIVNVVSIVMGLVGAAMVAVNLVKYVKGDPSSSDALIKVGGGLLIAVVILQIIKVTLLK